VVAGAGVKRGLVYGKSDKTASAPVDNPVHPRELLATLYHSVGIDPNTIVYNHLNQPRELVQGDPVTGILS
jgi:molybdopterin-guanine dinucleotide biosynthesis protein A